MSYIRKKKNYLDTHSDMDKTQRNNLLNSLDTDYKRANKNTYNDFIGIDKMKECLYNQLNDFEQWARNEDWSKFHHSHYDWWTFPIPEGSSKGMAYTVYEDEVNQLFKDCRYINSLKRCTDLVCKAWGWDLYNRKFIENPAYNQKWSNWPIRLYKMAFCLEFLGLSEAISVRLYGQYLINKGYEFTYCNYNLEYIFDELDDD